jgi:hypothetical protein
MSENTNYNFKERFNTYKSSSSAEDWLNNNFERVRSMFKDIRIRDYIFEPFKNVFKERDGSSNSKITSAITLVAVSNMVLAGLPGKLGLGVTVSMGLEGWMAFTIAKQVGLKIENISDIWKYFGLLAAISLTIIEGFRQLLGFGFSLFSIVPGINPLILAELFVTDFVGVLFWVGFEETKKQGSFSIPLKTIKSIYDRTKEIITYQKDLIVGALTIENLKLVGKRLKSWLLGEINIDKAALRGEIFPFIAMANLIKGNYDTLNGPLGTVFINAIRRGYSNQLSGASLDEMKSFFNNRTPEQLKGDVSLVKGEMRESLGELHENTDGDTIFAELHNSRMVPGSDVVFTDLQTGDRWVVQYKSVSDPALIERALDKYPDIPIVATSEMEEYFGDHPLVMFDGISDSDLQQVTEENFERLSGLLEKVDATSVAATSVAAKTIASLWPFVMAYIRKKITQDQMETVITKVLGESGATLASRISWAILLGPVFAWYLLARSVTIMFRGAENLAMGNKPIIHTIRIS